MALLRASVLCRAPAAVCSLRTSDGIDRVQLMVPEQLLAAIIQEHVQGHVLGGSKPFRDLALPGSYLALPASQFGSQERIAYLHPHPNSRFFGVHFQNLPSEHQRSSSCCSLNKAQGRTVVFLLAQKDYFAVLFVVVLCAQTRSEIHAEA